MKKFLHIFFLVGVILIKMSASGIHVYTHHDDLGDSDEPCELCEHAVQSQDTAFTLVTASYEITEHVFHFSFQDNLYLSTQKVQPSHSALFGRPPPMSLA